MSIEQDRIIASDTNTAPEILSKLAFSYDKITLENIVANPNCNAEILLKLGYEFPEEVIEHPEFKLLYQEEPESDFVKICLFRSVKTPI